MPHYCRQMRETASVAASAGYRPVAARAAVRLGLYSPHGQQQGHVRRIILQDAQSQKAEACVAVRDPHAAAHSPGKQADQRN